MTRHLQSRIAFSLALSVLVILVSPYVASAFTTVRSPQNTHPPAAALPMALYAPIAAWLALTVYPAAWKVETNLALPGSEIVSLTCSRLC